MRGQGEAAKPPCNLKELAGCLVHDIAASGRLLLYDDLWRIEGGARELGSKLNGVQE